MAATNSTEYANTVATPAVRNNSVYWGGRVRTFRGTYTFAAQASGDTINLVTIPKGYRIIGMVASMTATHGGTATIALGDSAAAAKFRAAATLTASGFIGVAPAAVGATDSAAVVGADTPYTSATVIVLTIAAAALPGSGRAYIDFLCVQD